MKDTILNNHQMRFYRFQKNRFTKYVEENFDVTIQKSLVSRNIIIGDPMAKTVIMAHYDTPPNMNFMLATTPLFGMVGAQIFVLVLTLILIFFLPIIFDNIVTIMIIQLLIFIYFILMLVIPNRNNVNDNTSGVILALELAKQFQDNKDICIVLTDFEEYGLIGAFAFKRKYGTSGRDVIVVDCVAQGSEIALISTGKTNRSLYDIFKGHTKHNLASYKSKLLASDNVAVGNNAVLISGVDQGKVTGLVIPNMHTNKDKHFDQVIYDDIKLCLSKYIANIVT